MREHNLPVESHVGIVDRNGRPHKVATKLELAGLYVRQNTVACWVTRNSIPRDYWQALDDLKMASVTALDLRANLTRILRRRPTPAGPPAPPLQASPVWFDNIPGADDPTWRRISAELEKLIRTGAYGSWFSRLGFTGLAGGALGLTTPNRICADKLRADFLPEIRRAAALAGLEVERVIIGVRQGPPPPAEPQ